jgi:tRNA modification GTPase
MFHVKHFAPETIAAIATPLGRAGVGVVRVSGPESRRVLKAIFPAARKQTVSHKMLPGWVVDQKRQMKIDQGMACFMKGPRSYTGEDTAEIYCHGGIAIMQEVLALTLKAGARLAERGEFTKRAFLNGKLDLAQVEAVIDLINSNTRSGAGWAAKQLEGRLSSKILKIRQKALRLLAKLEAEIDYPEDYKLGKADVRKALARLDSEIGKMIDLAGDQRIYRHGVKVVIAGRPNVGKSSLLNALLKEERAIVTSLPGTTRDAIEELMEIEGVPIAITDTAGLRASKDKAEQAGVSRTGEELVNAGLVLVVIDGSQLTRKADRELLNKTKEKQGLVVINKIDRGNKVDRREIETLSNRKRVLAVSAKTGKGVRGLEKALAYLLKSNYKPAGRDPIYLNARHILSLENANRSLQMALKSAINIVFPEMVAIDLKSAIVSLGEVTGETVSEEVIDEIFNSFCVGK